MYSMQYNCTIVQITTNYCTGCTVLYCRVQPRRQCNSTADADYNILLLRNLACQIHFIIHVGMVRGTRYSSLPCCADYLSLTVARVFWRAMFSQFTRGAGLVHLKPDNCRRERGEGGKAGGVGGSMAFPSLTHPLSHSCFRFLPPNMDIFPNMLSHSFPPNC